ncbi:MAG TPA: DUF3179 domain-containing protein, partial [bacterium]|nr:DUF3179 domain-containing protein [bacterium]
SGSLIPADEIVSVGPPRDGIPAIDNPKFVQPGEADFLRADDRVLGIVEQGTARAYPINIMNWHEIVNDEFGDDPVVMTYCPLCGSGMAYDAHVAGKDRAFGVSGLLYNNEVLLYDRQSESLWSQIMSEVVSGPLKGRELEQIPMSHTTWEDWRSRHPDTQVLSTETGYARNYSRDPYSGYQDDKRIMFPVSNSDDRYPRKELVLGVEINGEYKAYPFSELRQTSGKIRDSLNGQQLIIRFDSEHQSAKTTDGQGKEIPAVMLYWFAWTAFHPETGEKF